MVGDVGTVSYLPGYVTVDRVMSHLYMIHKTWQAVSCYYAGLMERLRGKGIKESEVVDRILLIIRSS